MSYRSFIKSLPPTLHSLLRQPTYVAGIASVGIHGFFWVVLPLLPIHSSTPTEPEIQRTVSLVELTPGEQSRLPDFSTPQVTLPTAPDPSSDLYSLSPLPNSFSPIPTQPSAPSYPTFPSIPSFLPPPPPFNLPPSYIFPRTTRPQSPSPSPSPQSSSGQPTQTPTPSSSTTQTPGAQAVNPETSPTPSSSPNAPASPQPGERLRQDLIARQQELRELFTYSSTGTSRNRTEVLANYRQWSEQVNDQLNDTTDNENLERQEISAPYPLEACFSRLQATVVVGVVVDTGGKVMDEPAPTVLQSSGYGFFNLRALEIAKSHEFEAKESKRAYQVYVEFNPDNRVCPPVSTPSPSPSAANPG